MLQRFQSVFLVLVALCMFAMVFFPIWEKSGIEMEGHVVTLTALEMTYLQGEGEAEATPTFYIAALACISAALAIGSILSYKNRMKQVKINLANTLVIFAVMMLNVYFLFEGTTFFEQQNQGSFEVGFYLPLAALLFNFLANRFIRKDEQLVRSVDRLR